MAVFSNTVVGTRLFGDQGYVIEYGTWSDANSDGTGAITSALQVSGSPTLCVGKIDACCFTSDGNHPVASHIAATTPSTVTITVTAADTGTYALIGKGK